MQEPESDACHHLAEADPDGAGLSPAERELMRYVKLVTEHAYRTTDEDVQTLRDVGWSDEQIAEATYIIALFAFFNRVADAFGLADPNYFAAPPLMNPDDYKDGIAPIE